MRRFFGIGFIGLHAVLVPLAVNAQQPANRYAVNPASPAAEVGSKEDNGAAKINANLDKLSPEDRKLALAQGYCPVMPDVRLGEMGSPIKLTANGQEVFVCCQGCQKKALADPAKTLAVVRKLKERVAADAEVQANLGQLESKDRELAAAQGYCAVISKNRLGSMGPPIKLIVSGQPVFLCCQGCSKRAMADPKKTLATVETLKTRVKESGDIEASLAKLGPADRGLARAQGYCAVMTDNPLGTMGTPIKVMVGGQPVFLCCQGCQKKALAKPEQTLAVVAKLREKVAAETAKK